MIEEKLNILLCEDDENLGMLLSEYLQAKNYLVDLESDGEKGLEAFSEKSYDVCILDVMMPIKDGFELARDIRKTNSDVPIIFLTAKNMKKDVLEGFKIGADDYINKPFSMEELLFRIEAIIRRVKGKKIEQAKSYNIGKFFFDTQKQLLIIGDEKVKLTTKENDLLMLLCVNKNNILERNSALMSIWEENTYFNARSMDVYITKLRKHLKLDPDVEIMNIHGKGYKLVVPD